jgi:tRNA(adenine34) deaminase
MQALSEEAWMSEALDEAERAPAHGDVPVACIVVNEQGEELGRGHNRREELGDPAAHAEILALRAAAQKRGHWRLEGCTVYATLEPCPMCAGALVSARIQRLVYATRDPKAGAVDTLYRIGQDGLLNHRFSVLGGVLAERAATLLQEFFAKLRGASQRE